MKKVFIMGGSYADIPIIKSAKKKGYFVVTSGNNPNDLGHKYSDDYIEGDYSDKEKMLKIVEENNFDNIAPSCNDFSMISVAYVAEQLGYKEYDSYETTLTIHHKDKFRKFALDNSISVPKAISVKSFDEVKDGLDLKFPVIVKPVDLTGGKGISIVNNIANLKNALDNALLLSKSNDIVIEEYIQGSKHGFTAILKEQKIVFSMFDDEQYFINQFLVSGASYPSKKYNKDIEKNIISQLEKIASILNLKDGILHTQLVLSDKPYIIEITRRHPGDFYLKLVEYAKNINYSDIVFDGYVKEKYDYDINSLKGNKEEHNVVRHCIMMEENRMVIGVDLSRIDGEILYYFQLFDKNIVVKNYLVDKLGIVFVEYDTRKELYKKVENLNDNIMIKYK